MNKIKSSKKPVQEDISNPTPKTKNGSKKNILIVLGVIFIIFLVGGSAIYFTLSKKEEDDSSATDDTDELNQDLPQSSEGDTILQEACQNAPSDYPEWTTNTGIVLWEDLSDEKFNFSYRESPEDSSVSITSPAQSNEQLMDLDLLGVDTFGYAKMNSGKTEVGSVKFSEGSDSSIIYSKSDEVNLLDISFINNDKFIMLYSTNSGQTILEYINTINGTEQKLLILESSLPVEDVERNTRKVAVSPKSTYVYMVDSSLVESMGAIKVFDLSSKKQIGEIEKGTYPVWVGDKHILYSLEAEDKGVFLYEIEGRSKYKVSGIDSKAVDLSFNPESGGMIAYNTDKEADNSTGFIINCQDLETIASYSNGKVEAFTDKETTIITSSTSAFNGSGFWRFNTDWTLIISEKLNKYSSRPAIATAWNNY